MSISFIKSIDEKFLRTISKSSPSKFCFFSNLRQNLIFRSKTNFNYSKKLNLFFAKEEDIKVYFFSPYRQLRLYSRGIKRRLKNLLEDYFINKIYFKDNDIVVDCGANIGELYIALNMNFSAKINYIGFEPSPNEFKCLSLNASNQKHYQVALSDKSKKQKFYISSEEADNSLIEPKYFSKTIDLKSDRLDKIVSENKIKLLKIDAEGAEIEVLKGSKNIFRNIEYISVDLGPERGINSEPTFKDVIPYLINNGFIIQEISQKRYTFLFYNPTFND